MKCRQNQNLLLKCIRLKRKSFWHSKRLKLTINFRRKPNDRFSIMIEQSYKTKLPKTNVILNKLSEIHFTRSKVNRKKFQWWFKKIENRHFITNNWLFKQSRRTRGEQRVQSDQWKIMTSKWTNPFTGPK